MFKERSYLQTPDTPLGFSKGLPIAHVVAEHVQDDMKVERDVVDAQSHLTRVSSISQRWVSSKEPMKALRLLDDGRALAVSEPT